MQYTNSFNSLNEVQISILRKNNVTGKSKMHEYSNEF